jgi:hypothetical protein
MVILEGSEMQECQGLDSLMLLDLQMQGQRKMLELLVLVLPA